MPNYLFLKKKLIINFMDDFESRILFWGKKLLIIKNTNLEVIRDNWSSQ